MRRFALTVAMLLAFLPVVAQEIVSAEYFWDVDPGVGAGESIPVDAGQKIEPELTISTDNLTTGIHFLHVRTMTSDGVWSLYMKVPVYVLEPVKTYTIEGAEYFWDLDPGAGAGIPVDVEEPTDISALASTAGLEPGIHFFYFRLKNSQNEWSPYLRRMVHVLEPAEVSGNITAYRYSYNVAPGDDAPITEIEPSAHWETEINLSTEGLAEGDHVVYLQVKDENDQWSNVLSAPFTISECAYNSPNAVSQVAPARIGEELAVDLNLALAGSGAGPLTFEALEEPEKGEFFLEEGRVSYTPVEGTVGPDSVYYKVCNSCGACDSAWWYMDIANEPPVMLAGDFEISQGEVGVVNLAEFLFDANANIDPASVSVAEPLSSGAVVAFTGPFQMEIDYSGSGFSGQEELVLQVCDEMGACVQQTFVIVVEGGATDVRVYNAVSPNGDGQNDYLHIENISQYPGARLVVANRWGDKVFEIEDYNNSGRRFEGYGNTGRQAKLPPGFYFYELLLQPSGQKISGSLYLKY